MTDILSVDIEWMVTYALARSGRLPWSRPGDQALSYDRGLTARPRRRAPGSWALAEACAGLRIGAGREVPATMTPSGDVAIVIEAIKRLHPRAASLILACGRAHIRPDYTVEGRVEPTKVLKSVKCRKRKRRIDRMVWDVDPEAIRAARAAYTAWHDGLHHLTLLLAGRLSGFRINGLSAPAEPWREAAKKTA